VQIKLTSNKLCTFENTFKNSPGFKKSFLAHSSDALFIAFNDKSRLGGVVSRRNPVSVKIHQTLHDAVGQFDG
jgi:hypothetical protein